MQRELNLTPALYRSWIALSGPRENKLIWMDTTVYSFMISWLKKVGCIIHIKGHLFFFVQFSTIPLSSKQINVRKYWQFQNWQFLLKLLTGIWYLNTALLFLLFSFFLFSLYSFLFFPPYSFILPLYSLSSFLYFFDTNSNFVRAEIANIFNWTQELCKQSLFYTPILKHKLGFMIFNFQLLYMLHMQWSNCHRDYLIFIFDIQISDLHQEWDSNYVSLCSTVPEIKCFAEKLSLKQNANIAMKFSKKVWRRDYKKLPWTNNLENSR